MSFLKKKLSELKSLERKVKGLNSSKLTQQEKLKTTSLLVQAYRSIGHKTETTKMIEFIKENKVEKEKRFFEGKLRNFVVYWNKTIVLFSSDEKSDLPDWRTEHEFSGETVNQFLLNLFDLCNRNHLMVLDGKFSEVKVKDFEEYLDRSNVWENEMIASTKGKEELND